MAGPATNCPCCGAPVTGRWPVVDLHTNTVAWGRKAIMVDAKLAELLYALIATAPAVATRQHLAAQLWGAFAGDRIGNALSVYILLARRTLRHIAAPVAIETIWGTGFVLRALPARAASPKPVARRISA